MIELLRQQLKSGMSDEQKINITRETLQTLILKILYDKGYFRNLAFVGGTALRFLFGLRRFSEDLDFYLVNKKGYDFSALNSGLKRELELNGLHVDFKHMDSPAAQITPFRFNNLLKEMGIINSAARELYINMEIGPNPPAGWKLETALVNKIYIMKITHFDLPSLYATKLHACFFRKYIKGRDFYDLIWYIAKGVVPNYKLLNNAIMQTEHYNPRLAGGNINTFMLEHLKKVDFDAVKKDVERFLEDRRELNLLNKKTIEESLKRDSDAI